MEASVGIGEASERDAPFGTVTGIPGERRKRLLSGEIGQAPQAAD
jgi:hypothetical protein